MSGERRVLTTDERLQQCEREVGVLRRERHTIETNVRHQVTTEFQKRLEPLAERQRQYERWASTLEEGVRDLETQTARRMGEQQREFSQVVGQVRGELRDLAQDTTRRLEQHRRDFDRKLQQQKQELQNQVKKVSERVSNLEERAQREASMATHAVQLAEEKHNFISETTRHDKFAPGQLDRISFEVEQAQRNLADSPPAALAQAQTAWLKLVQLQEEVIDAQQEWEAYRAAALQQALVVLELAEINRWCEGIDFDNSGQSVGKVDIDHWSQGRLHQFIQTTADLVQRIKTDETITTGELKALVEWELPLLDKQQEEIVQSARLEEVSSQLRINVADRVLQALESQRFFHVDDTYEGQDMRAGFVAKAKHADGAEVSICVMPVEGHPGQHALHINSYDFNTSNQREVELRQQAILDTLQQQGLAIGASQCLDKPNQEFRNIEDVQNRPPIAKPSSAASPGQPRSQNESSATSSRPTLRA